MAIARVKTWNESDQLTAADLNAEIDNIISNVNDPGQIDDSSPNTTAFQATSDPGESGSESLPTTLTEELKRLRFAIKEIKGTTYWYESPGNTLLQASANVIDESIPVFDGTDGKSLKQTPIRIIDTIVVNSSASTTFSDTGVTDASAWDLANAQIGMLAVANTGAVGIINTIDDTNNIINVADWIPANPSNGDLVSVTRYDVKVEGVLDVTANNMSMISSANSDATLTVNSTGTGDAKLDLKVNGVAANTWTFMVDNGTDDDLLIQYGGTTKIKYDMGTGFLRSVSGGLKADYFEAESDDASAPAANYLYKANIPKAWASFDFATSPTVAIDNDHNIASASYSTSALTVNIDTDMADALYAVSAMSVVADSNLHSVYGRTTALFYVQRRDSDGLLKSYDGSDEMCVIVMGDQ